MTFLFKTVQPRGEPFVWLPTRGVVGWTVCFNCFHNITANHYFVRGRLQCPRLMKHSDSKAWPRGWLARAGIYKNIDMVHRMKTTILCNFESQWCNLLQVPSLILHVSRDHRMCNWMCEILVSLILLLPSLEIAMCRGRTWMPTDCGKSWCRGRRRKSLGFAAGRRWLIYLLVNNCHVF